MSGSQQLLLGGVPTVPAVDPYFYSVTSLLHGDGTNGGQNNTFLDSSSNNFTITRNGNTTQGSFSPFSQTGWSGYFNGSSDYISVADSADFTMGSGDFTVQCWVYSTANSGSDQYILGQVNSTGAAAATSFQLYKKATSNVAEAYVYAGGSKAATGTAQIPVGQWTHLAMVRDGGTLRLYVNGSQDGTNATLSTTAITDSAASFSVGRTGDYNGVYFAGYVSNVSVVKGTCLFPSGTTFTPSTTPLSTSTSGQSVLLCQANRFIDTNTATTAKTVTVGSTSSIQPFSPFNPTTAYSTSAVGGSGYFDGSGDYLNTASNAAFALGSGSFTIEMWVYSGANGTSTRLGGNGAGGSFTTNRWIIATSTAANPNKFTLAAFNTSPVDLLVSTSTFNNSQWMHVAIARSGNAWAMWVNGAREAYVASNSAALDGGSSEVFNLGRSNISGDSDWAGYVSGFKMVKGTAVYDPASTTITVPTSPATNTTNTSLLLSCTNGAIFDNAAVADYETVGNAQISTSVKKYGTGSMSFDGTGDWLVAPASPSWDFGSGDFTVELWVNPSVITVNEALVSKGNASSTGNEVWSLQWYGTNQLAFFSGGGLGTPVVTTGSVFATGNWYHVAVCRTAGVTKIFVNGTEQSTSTTSYTITAGGALYVGAGWYAPASRDISGYIDDLRISKGVGRYQYNFTPPTAALPDIGGTITLTADPYYEYTTLLLPGNGTNGAQNNTFLDSSTNAFTITRNGNTTQGTFSPFSQTGWGNYFDGSSNLVTTASQVIPTGSFTIEAWAFVTSSSATQTILAQGTGVGDAGRTWIGIESSSGAKWAVQIGGTQAISSLTPVLNSWTHVAMTYNGSTITLYVNGTSVASASITQNASNTTLKVGANWGAYNLTGYVSNARVSNSVIYTSNFTPSTSPFSAAAGTVFLSCQSNRFVDTSSNAYAITTSGSPSVQAFSPFNPTAAWSAATNGGSGYFDGSGDYLSLADNAAFNMGTGNFTAEFWLYTADQTNNYPGIISASVFSDTGAISVRYDNTGNANKIFVYLAGASPSDPLVTSSAYAFGQWIHVAIVRDSTTALKIYVNGTLDGTGTITSGQVVDFSGANSFYIGRGFDVDGGAAYLAGYISSVRLVKGTAVYTGNFTPPTGPLTAIANTSFLCNFTNAGIYDATSKNDLETVGNAQISTTQSKFGGSSMYFDGTGDWLQGRNTRLLDIGSGDFTIEGWLYPTTSGTTRAIVAQFNTNGTGPGWTSYLKTTNVIEFYGGSGTITVTGTGTVSANAWSHFAICRYGSTITIYVNGIAGGTGTNSSFSDDTTGPVEVGARGGAGAIPFTGYIDDLRITKGIARYTSNFTPPTTAFLTL